MAAALGADVCEIYTDVEGVFTADPRIEPRARKIDVISYEEMLELAAAGAKVLSSRSVEYARRHTAVKLHVRSSFEDVPGTWVQEVDEQQMEDVLISGVALDNEEAKVTLDRVPDRAEWRRWSSAQRAKRGHQRRHDRAERVARRRDRPVVHRAASPTFPALETVMNGS